MKTYPINEARAAFSKLFERALAGEPQRVTRYGKEAVMIVSEAEWQARSRSAPTLGHLLALTVTPADQGDREQVAALAEEVQQVTGGTVELAYVDQGYTGPNAAEAAQQHGLRLEVVKHPMAKRGFVLLPRRWVVERSFAWAARFRRLARDYERLDTTLKGLHLLAFATLMLRNLADTLK